MYFLHRARSVHVLHLKVSVGSGNACASVKQPFAQTHTAQPHISGAGPTMGCSGRQSLTLGRMRKWRYLCPTAPCGTAQVSDLLQSPNNASRRDAWQGTAGGGGLRSTRRKKRFCCSSDASARSACVGGALPLLPAQHELVSACTPWQGDFQVQILPGSWLCACDYRRPTSHAYGHSDRYFGRRKGL